MLSYASHGTQCGVTISLCSCCGCYIRDNHIYFTFNKGQLGIIFPINQPILIQDYILQE